jgi:hypothetical protein
MTLNEFFNLVHDRAKQAGVEATNASKSPEDFSEWRYYSGLAQGYMEVMRMINDINDKERTNGWSSTLRVHDEKERTTLSLDRPGDGEERAPIRRLLQDQTRSRDRARGVHGEAWRCPVSPCNCENLATATRALALISELESPTELAQDLEVDRDDLLIRSMRLIASNALKEIFPWWKRLPSFAGFSSSRASPSW